MVAKETEDVKLKPCKGFYSLHGHPVLDTGSIPWIPGLCPG